MHLGHQVGGRLLRSIADVLRKQANNAAFAARIRGDEFAVLLPAARSGAGYRFAERFSATLAEARFVLNGEDIRPSVSIGVVESDAALTTTQAVMKAADVARRAAQAAGGVCVRVHDLGVPQRRA